MSLPKNFVISCTVISKVDSTAEINYELFSEPLFETTYIQTQHTVGLVFMLCASDEMSVDKIGGIFCYC